MIFLILSFIHFKFNLTYTEFQITFFLRLLCQFYNVQPLQVISQCFEAHVPFDVPLVLQLRFVYAFPPPLFESPRFVFVALSLPLEVRKPTVPLLSIYSIQSVLLKFYISLWWKYSIIIESFERDLPPCSLPDRNSLSAVERVWHCLRSLCRCYILYPSLLSHILLPIDQFRIWNKYLIIYIHIIFT